MEQLFHIIIPNPPTKHTKKNVKIKLDAVGKVVPETTYYFTANLFYSTDIHWATLQKIVGIAKSWVYKYLQEVPKLEKARIKITYHYPTDGFDLDNKAYFWTKIILDILKTPTSKQILRAEKFDNKIITVEAIPDDTVRYIDGIKLRYKKGAPALEIKIKGRKKDIQQTLF